MDSWSSDSGRPVVALVARRLSLVSTQRLVAAYSPTDFTLADLQELPA